MIVDLLSFPEDGMFREGEEEPSSLELAENDLVSQKTTVKYALNVNLVSDELIVKGRIGVDVEFACSRCSAVFPVFIEEKEFFRAVNVDSETQSVDLTADIREAILLLFPAYPVCSAKCKGLCPHCGMNFNDGSCECKKPSDDRWGTLDQLKIED